MRLRSIEECVELLSKLRIVEGNLEICKKYDAMTIKRELSELDKRKASLDYEYKQKMQKRDQLHLSLKDWRLMSPRILNLLPIA